MLTFAKTQPITSATINSHKSRKAKTKKMYKKKIPPKYHTQQFKLQGICIHIKLRQNKKFYFKKNKIKISFTPQNPIFFVHLFKINKFKIKSLQGRKIE